MTTKFLHEVGHWAWLKTYRWRLRRQKILSRWVSVSGERHYKYAIGGNVLTIREDLIFASQSITPAPTKHLFEVGQELHLWNGFILQIEGVQQDELHGDWLQFRRLDIARSRSLYLGGVLLVYGIMDRDAATRQRVLDFLEQCRPDYVCPADLARSNKNRS